MADISMTYSSLQTAANQIRKAEGELQDVTAQLESAVSALEGDWLGESHQAFVNAWQESKPTIQRLTEAIGNFAPALDQTVARQQGTEGNNVKVISGLGF